MIKFNQNKENCFHLIKFNDDLQSKQAYLRENVLEMGYDADEFMSFLQMRKGENGLDLNNWTMHELISVVNDFVNTKKNIQNKYQEPEPEPEPEPYKEEENTQTQNFENETKDLINNDITNNINNNANNNIQNVIYEDVDENIGKCQANETTSFSNMDNIKVKLSSPKKIEGKMFTKAFISYVVSTEPFDFQTNKRYSDFAWLKKMLSLIYPNCVIPPLCKKNFTDRFTEALIEKRMRSIDKFMNGILEHPLVKNSSVVNDFLCMAEGREYNNRINNYNKIKKPPSFVRQIKTMNGEINIGINNEKETYFENIKSYAKGNYTLLQKITKGYKSLMNIMQQLSNKMSDISKLWKQVLDKSVKYSDSHNTSETFNIMSKLMETWSEIEKSQMKVININIREYFRYVKNEFKELKEMSDRVQNSQTTYIKLKEKLLKTKETLFEKQDPETWQLKDEDKKDIMNLIKNKELAFSKMLPQDTFKLQETKNFYGAMLNSLISEFERIRKINARRHKDNTTKFVKELSSELTNLHVSLADRLSEFYDLKDENDTNVNKDENKLIQNVEINEENKIENKDENININNNNSSDKIEQSNIINENNKINNNENINVNNSIVKNDINNKYKEKEHNKALENVKNSERVDNNKLKNDKDNKNKKDDKKIENKKDNKQEIIKKDNKQDNNKIKEKNNNVKEVKNNNVKDVKNNKIINKKNEQKNVGNNNAIKENKKDDKKNTKVENKNIKKEIKKEIKPVKKRRRKTSKKRRNKTRKKRKK